jgi:hypothetical protein
MVWFRGDCHTHSLRSTGGELTPAQVAAEARAFGLDFIAATEHDTTDTLAAWATQSGEDLLVIPGRENITPAGHWLSLADRLRVVAHPHAPYPTGTFAAPLDGFDLIEVWNGPWHSDVPWQADNEAALATWSRDPAARPAIGNSDIHLAGQLGAAHTVVRADELTTEAILTSLAAGRSWITDAVTTELTFEARRGGHVAQIGDRLPPTPSPAELLIQVHGVPGATISVHTEHGKVHETTESTARLSVVAGLSRVEVRHPDGSMAALTNPIFLG